MDIKDAISTGKPVVKEEITNVINLHKIKSTNASLIEPAKQPWLWQDYIPLETSTLVAGKGGIGKSQFLMWLASMVSNGGKFSINSIEYIINQGNVIILSAEDHEKYTIIPRLISANANRNKIHLISSAVDVDCEVNERFVTLDTDIKLLEYKIKEIANVSLLIIDPITAYIGNVRENRSSEVRSFLLRLNKLAENNKLANILNTHPRKSSGGEGPSSAADEVMGSNAWTNTPRVTISISKHHDNEELFVCNVSKTNYKKPSPLAYKISPEEITHNNQMISTSKIVWENAKIDMTADEAVNKKVYEARLEIDRAKEFILTILKFGSKDVVTITRLAEQQDISLPTLKRARQKLALEGTPIISEPSRMDARKMIWYIGNSTK